MTDPNHIKLYLAARYHADRANPEHHNPLLRAPATEDYPYHLESFHYLGKGECDRDIRRNVKAGWGPIFMDSGAFSMFTQGIKMDLDAYGRFLVQRADYVEVASNVDVIGAGNEQGSYDNQKYLESLKLPVKVCPVHHARDDDRWLVRYLDEGYDYLFLGGMVPETTKYLYEWLDHIFDKYLAMPDGTARIKVHGFGLTTFELMDRYPWYSVDSTSWMMVAVFGSILMDVGGKPRAISFSEKSPAKKTEGRSFWSLDAMTQDHIRSTLKAEGFTPEDLAESYGMREKWNIRFYRRFMEKTNPVFVRRAVTFF
jgi:hypothetical protein